MFWKRLALLGMPLVLGLAGVRTMSMVLELRGGTPEDCFFLGVAEEADHLNPFRAGNGAAERVKGALYDSLLGYDESLELKAALLESWEATQTTRYFFISERHAQEALGKIMSMKEKREEWGITELSAVGDEVRVVFEGEGGGVSAEIFAGLDASKLLPVKRLAVRVLQSAQESYRDFKATSLEGTQVRREWFDTNSSYQLLVAGVTENFFREFKSYYESNKNLGASFRFEEDLDYLEEPEHLFRLRRDVLWHDGTPLTSADLVYSFELSRRQPWNRELRGVFASVHSISAVDEAMVRVVYRDRSPIELARWSLLPVVPRHVLEGKDEAWWRDYFEERPVGTGPWRLASRGAGGRLVLEANGDYYLGAPRASRMEMITLPDAAECRLRLLAGQIDSYAPGVRERDFLAADPRFDVYPASEGKMTLVAWNVGREPWDSIVVREALIRAVAVEDLARGVPFYAERLTGVFHPASRYYGGGCELPGADPDASLKMLGESGWVWNGEGELVREGEAMKLRLGVVPGVSPAAAVFVERCWESIGIDVEVAPLSGRVLEASGEGGFFGSGFDAAILEAPMPKDWTSFRHGVAGRLVEEAITGFAAGEGGPREILGALDGNPEDDALVQMGQEFQNALCERQVLGLLFRRREDRVFRRGGLLISRAVGDGQRVEKGPGGEEAGGIDYYFPWWVKPERGSWREGRVE